MFDALAGADVLKDARFVGLEVGRDELKDGLADHLFRGVAEYAGGGGVPTSDDAVEVFTDDDVIRRFDDRGEFSRTFGEVALRLFDLLARGDVAENFGRADDIAVFILDGRQS